MRKKRQQHIVEIRILRPTALTVSRMYLSDAKSDKVMGIRPDTLAMILQKASLRPMSQVLVLDQCVGLIVASVAERLGGYGRVLAPYFTGPGPNAECVNAFGLDLSIQNSIVHFPAALMKDASMQDLPDDDPVLVSEYVHDASNVNAKGRTRSGIGSSVTRVDV